MKRVELAVDAAYHRFLLSVDKVVLDSRIFEYVEQPMYVVHADKVAIPVDSHSCQPRVGYDEL